MSTQPYHVFTAKGDARSELDELIRETWAGDRQVAGLHKVIFVSRADQTVAFLDDRDVPLARLLRARTGWTEPPQ